MASLKPVLLFLAAAAVAGCQATRVRMVLTQEQSREGGLHLDGPVAVNPDGELILSAKENLYRGDPVEGGFRPLLAAKLPLIRGVTVLDDGVVVAARGDALLAPLSGYPIEVVKLPHAATSLSAHHGAVYVITRDAGGVTRLLRYAATDRQLRTLLVTKDPVQALCGVRGGCLMASNGSVFKVTDPEPGQEESVVALAFATESPVRSLAADSDRRIVYFSDGDRVFAWTKGRIVPLFPSGGWLAWGDDSLAIVSPGRGQVVQITKVSGLVDEILDQASAPPPPRRPSEAASYSLGFSGNP
jgi:hypothetical protein